MPEDLSREPIRRPIRRGMWGRFSQLLVAELFAFGTFVCAGLALLGAAVTWTGESRHPAFVSWALVAVFASMAAFFGKLTAVRLRAVFARSSAS